MKRILMAGLALAAWHAAASAQFGLQSAGGTTSLLSDRFSVLALETGESSLSLLYRSGRFGQPAEWFANTQLTLMAPGGERDLFAGGRWVPGMRFQHRMARRSNGQNGGWVAFFGSLGYEALPNAVARYADAAGTSLVLEDRTGQTLSLGGGVNWRPTPLASRLGFSADLNWSWGVPVSGSPSQVCFTQAEGPAGAGGPAVVSRCSRRFFGGVHDARAAHLRLDFISPHYPRRTQVGAELRSATLQRRRDTVQSEIQTVLQPAGRQARADLEEAGRRLAQAWDSLAAAPADSMRLREVAEATAAVRRSDDTAHAAADRLDAARARRDALGDSIEKVQRGFLEGPTLTLIGAVSSDLADGVAPRLRVAAGPALHPSLAPLRVTAALLLELDDLTNVDGARGWRDRFAVRLYLGLPFGER